MFKEGKTMSDGGAVIVFITTIIVVVYLIIKKDYKVTLASALHILGIATAIIGFIYFVGQVDLPKLVKVSVLFIISATVLVYGYRMSRK